MVEEAMECAKSYLLFHEGEEFMTENVDYYREAVGHDVKPREVGPWLHPKWHPIPYIVHHI